jgi:AraC family transcriptional regulator
MGLRGGHPRAHISHSLRARSVGFGQVWSTTKVPVEKVKIAPADTARRREAAWHGMAVECIEVTGQHRIDCCFRASMNMLVAYDQGSRRGGETTITGMPPSTLRNFTKKLTFVPAGHDFRDVHEDSTLTRVMYFYFDLKALQLCAEAGADKLVPRLLFEDSALWATAAKLNRAVENQEQGSRLYSEALATLLVHELLHQNLGATRAEANARGGLAAWQKRKVTSYIEEHLGESISLSEMAELARLSSYHFCRAFKQSFGTPPHRFHISRRIERAKVLLSQRSASITEIALGLGFSETSSFTATFRRTTGLTPSQFRRGVV